METFWIGSFDFGGYELQVVSKTKRECEKALFAIYKKITHKTTSFTTWKDFDDYFSPRVQETKLNEVVWP